MSSNLIKTGIVGLDELVEYGLPKGFSYAIVGGPGSGKTILGCQFLYKGITAYKENGIYVTFEEPPYSIANNMQRFSWNLYSLESRGLFAFVDASPIRGEVPGRYVVKGGPIGTEQFNVQGVLGLIIEAKKNIDAKRCVIDSITSLMLQYRDEFEARQNLLTLIKALTELRLTTLLLVERSEERSDVAVFGPESFLAQGIIIFHKYRIGGSIVRALEVRKMRGVKTTEKLCPYKITDNGIEVYPGEPVIGME